MKKTKIKLLRPSAKLMVQKSVKSRGQIIKQCRRYHFEIGAAPNKELRAEVA